MAPGRNPGPICKTNECHEPVEDGTSARAASPKATPVGSPTKAARRVVAKGACAFLNPQSRGTVIAPGEAFDRLRHKAGEATISTPQPKDSYTWPDKTASKAVGQEIQIDGQTIQVIRPTDDDAKGKNLPSTKQAAEALRAIPAVQRALTKTVILSPKSSPGRDSMGAIVGEGGGGTIALYPIDAGQTQTDFDNRFMHESGHNYQEKLWADAGGVRGWETAASADDRRPSPYAANNTGDDFCEFGILFNTAKGTSCEETAKQIYPSRWKKMDEYTLP